MKELLLPVLREGGICPMKDVLCLGWVSVSNKKIRATPLRCFDSFPKCEICVLHICILKLKVNTITT